MLELLMLTPVSTVLPPVNYEAANEHFDLTLTDDCNEEVDEIIDSCRRIMEALPVRIPLVTKSYLAQEISIVPPNGPRFRCWFYREAVCTMYTHPFLKVA